MAKNKTKQTKQTKQTETLPLSSWEGSDAQSAQEAHQIAEDAAVAAAPVRRADLTAFDAAARQPRASRATRKASAPAARGPTFEQEVAAALKAAGKPIKVAAIVAWWISDHPDLGSRAIGAIDARKTEAIALERVISAEAAGDVSAACDARRDVEAAGARAARAQREQAEATVSARVYTAAKKVGSGIERAARGEVQAA
jgi:hypothetical protein